MRIFDALAFYSSLERRKHDAHGVGRAIRSRRYLRGARGERILPFGTRHDVIHQIPFERAFAAHAFLDGAEKIRAVAPDAAFIDQSGEAAGAGQHRQQWYFRQGHGRRTIVEQNEVVGGKRQLIAAAGTGTVDRTYICLPRMGAGIFHGEAGFVGEFAKIDFVCVAGSAQHADIGAGAEHPVVG